MGTVKMRSLTVMVVFVFAGKAIFPVEGTRLKEHDDIGGDISDQSKSVWSENGLGWMLGKSSNYLKAGMMLVSIAHGGSNSAERFCGDKEEREYKKGCLVYNCTSTGFNTVKVLE